MTSEGVDGEWRAENICEASALINVKKQIKFSNNIWEKEINQKGHWAISTCFSSRARTCVQVCPGFPGRGATWGVLPDNLTHPTRHHPWSVGGAALDVANFATCSGRSSVCHMDCECGFRIGILSQSARKLLSKQSPARGSSKTRKTSKKPATATQIEAHAAYA